MEQISKIWQTAFNKKHTGYNIVEPILEDVYSCIYRLDDGREVRITTKSSMYNFSTALRNKTYKHIAGISDCFKIVLPGLYGEPQNVFCIVGEPLKRNFTTRANIQSGINLFRDLWTDCIVKKHRLDSNPFIDIETAYSNLDEKSRTFVIHNIKCADATQVAKDVALAIDEAYHVIKPLDTDSFWHPYPDNIGLGENGDVKICNIDHKFMGLDNNYEIETDSNSITVKYDPIIDEYNVKNNQMLMPLKVLVGSNEELVLGLIDTGAMSSGFSDDFFEYASLKNLGKTTMRGCTGKREAIKTFCFVTFPNGQIESLRGLTISPDAEVSIVIGMDLLSRCKFESEPYCNGFKYKLTFL